MNGNELRATVAAGHLMLRSLASYARLVRMQGSARAALVEQ